MDGEKTKRIIGFHKHFPVEEIATFPVICFDVNDLNDELLELYSGFDFIPMKKGGAIFGVYERNVTSQEKSIQGHIQHLDEKLLIEANASLDDLIDKFREHCSYFLVLRGAKIEGIVTRSDLLKLPVRVYAFSKIAELELLMQERIKSIYEDQNDEYWLKHLTKNRQKKLDERLVDYKNKNLDPDKIELTTLEDKATILKKSCPEFTNIFCDSIGSITQLRNQLVHAGDYASNQKELNEFLRRMDLITDSIIELNEKMVSKTTEKKIEETIGRVWGEKD
jgi:CBS domain-containing protein